MKIKINNFFTYLFLAILLFLLIISSLFIYSKSNGDKIFISQDRIKSNSKILKLEKTINKNIFADINEIGINLGSFIGECELYINDQYLDTLGSKTNFIFGNKKNYYYKIPDYFRNSSMKIKLIFKSYNKIRINNNIYIANLEDIKLFSSITNLFIFDLFKYISIWMIFIGLSYVFIGLKLKDKINLLLGIISIIYFIIGNLLFDTKNFKYLNSAIFELLIINIYLIISIFYIKIDLKKIYFKILFGLSILSIIIINLQYITQLNHLVYFIPFLFLISTSIGSIFIIKSNLSLSYKLFYFIFIISIIIEILNLIFTFLNHSSLLILYTSTILILHLTTKDFVKLVNKFVNINSLNEELLSIENEVDASIKEIDNTYEKMSINYNSFKELSNYLNTTTHDLENYITEVSKLMGNITKTSDKISENESEGLNLAINESKLLKDLRNKLNQIDSSLLNIRKNSKVINQFSDNIETIGKQTTLLSLNASIEASRSYNFHKGFEIIAKDVKKLSDKSSHLAIEIREQIKEIYVEIQSSIEMSNSLIETFSSLNSKFNNFIEQFDINKNDIQFIVKSINEESENLNRILNISNELTNTSNKLESNIDNHKRVFEN